MKKFKRTPKGDGCYSICRADLLDILMRGGVLRLGRFGPMIYDPADTGRDEGGRWVGHKELHPRRDTCQKLLDESLIKRIEGDNSSFADFMFWCEVKQGNVIDHQIVTRPYGAEAVPRA